MEQTVVLIKPDGVKRGLIGEIIGRFEKAGLKLVALKMVWVDKKLATRHYGYNDEWFENVGKKVKEFYQEHGLDSGEEFNRLTNREIGKLVQGWNVDYLTEGPVVAMLLEAPGVVAVVRKMVGPTYPQSAPAGTIRGDYSFDSPLISNVKKRSIRNLIHASGSSKEAALERQLWFREKEIYSYQKAGERIILG